MSTALGPRSSVTFSYVDYDYRLNNGETGRLYNDNTIFPGFSVPQPMQNLALAGFSWPQGPVQPGPSPPSAGAPTAAGGPERKARVH